MSEQQAYAELLEAEKARDFSRDLALRHMFWMLDEVQNVVRLTSMAKTTKDWDVVADRLRDLSEDGIPFTRVRDARDTQASVQAADLVWRLSKSESK